MPSAYRCTFTVRASLWLQENNALNVTKYDTSVYENPTTMWE